MKCLIDADILVYELAFSGQYKHDDTGDVIIRDFDLLAERLDLKITSL